MNGNTHEVDEEKDEQTHGNTKARRNKRESIRRKQNLLNN